VRVCEKAKLIRGDPPKIALKGRVSPQKGKFGHYKNMQPLILKVQFYFSNIPLIRFNRAAVVQKI
jgi:hypothetical protein